MKAAAQFSVVYQDHDIVVLNKAAGLLVAADRWDPDAQRLDVLATKELCAEGERLFAVHRIDKDTSGLVIYGRNEEAHRTLSMAFENREVGKTYHALVYGRPTGTSSTSTSRFARTATLSTGRSRIKRAESPRGRRSVTLGACGPYSWIEAKPVTGRTHQIRVHLALSGLTIVCDPL